MIYQKDKHNVQNISISDIEHTRKQNIMPRFIDYDLVFCNEGQIINKPQRFH